jgi:long-chain acyl-CoA synthetase
MSQTITPPQPQVAGRSVLTDFFGPVVQEFGDRPALRWRQGYRHQGLTFAQLGQAVRAAARRLHDEGVRPGDRVLLLGPSGPEWVAAFFGVVAAGGVVVPLDETTRPEFATEVGRRTGARLQVVHTGFAAAAALPALPLEGFQPHALGDAGPFEPVRRRPDDLLEIVYTSGTTSRPKGVQLTHANVISNVTALRQVMAFPPESRFLSVLPLSHMLGQVLGLFVPLRFGGTTFFAGTRRPSVLRDCFRRERITVLVTVPAFLDRIRQQVLAAAERQGRGPRLTRALGLARRLPVALRRRLLRRVRHEVFPDLRFVFTGGAALRPDTEDFFEALGIHILQGYGMTEAAPVITSNTLTVRRPHTVGRALPGVEVWTAAEGEILVRGPNVTPGYLDDPEATRSLLEGGWLHTGDVGAADEAGFWRILGRKKDVLIGPSGMNVYPEDIEVVLNRLPGVRESCVVGLEEGGDLRIVGCVLMQEGVSWDARDALARANEQLAAHQRLQEVRRWPQPEFPRTRSLKVQRDAVHAGLQGQTPGQAPAAGLADPGDKLLTLLRECLKLPEGQALGEGDRLTAELGLDSLGRLDLLSRIEEQFGVDLPESAIDDRTTVADLRSRLAGQSPAATRLPFPRWARRPFWCGVRRLLGVAWRPLFRFYFPERSEGQEHLRGLSGPVFFIANHTSNLDTPALLAALPGRWRRRVAVAAAADYWFRPGWGLLGGLPGAVSACVYHAFPFSRTDAVEASLRYLGELMDEGWSVLIYPEGTRSRTGQLGPFKGGIGLLARAMQVPVVPVALVGCIEALPKGRHFPRPARIRVRFGPPCLPPFVEAPDVIAAQLEQRVRELAAGLHGQETVASYGGRGA